MSLFHNHDHNAVVIQSLIGTHASNYLCDFIADLTITTDKLTELFASVVDPKKVDELGWVYGGLDLPAYEADEIKKNYQSPTQRKEACLDLYVHQHPCPSWQQVARVLRQYPFYLNQQANFVENTYVKGTHRCSCKCDNHLGSQPFGVTVDEDITFWISLNYLQCHVDA